VFAFGKRPLGGREAHLYRRDLRGFAWVRPIATGTMATELVLRGTVIFGVIWIAASALLVLLLARSISRPLAILHRGHAGADELAGGQGGNFPLPVAVHNEIGDLIEAFNRMVASIAEQRAGLNDTLSLLDSMLANAPIGLAFFDRRCRFVRVNQVFADMTGVPLSRHLGRTLPELLPQPVAQELEDTVLRVFASEEPVRNLELDRCRAASRRPVDMAGQRLSGADHAAAGALGGRHCAGRERPQAQRRGPAQDRKAGRHRPPGRLHRPRDQQSAGGHHQPALPAAQLLPA
jgi:PAS domain S-box-containing protein